MHVCRLRFGVLLSQERTLERPSDDIGVQISWRTGSTSHVWTTHLSTRNCVFVNFLLVTTATEFGDSKATRHTSFSIDYDPGTWVRWEVDVPSRGPEIKGSPTYTRTPVKEVRTRFDKMSEQDSTKNKIRRNWSSFVSPYTPCVVSSVKDYFSFLPICPCGISFLP